jgi:HPt (histidine-containing phosphotransfer) domain-containing protein
MTIVDPVSVAAASRTERPVDLAHLARQTMGNADLEREVLRLFVRQTEKVLPRLAEAGADRASLAHVLVGSARGVGARRVAVAAQRLEDVARRDPAAGAGEFAELADAVEDANRFIRSLVAG